MRERALLICPGRGTYGRDQLGYLRRHHGKRAAALDVIDAHRIAHGRIPVRTLDARPQYSLDAHAASENASALIHACAMADVAAIDAERFDIVAVTGNSLGWYLALAAGGALSPEAAITLVDTMGALMARHGVGGQLLYPVVGLDWRRDRDRERAVSNAMMEAERDSGGRLFVSIRLGGYWVIAGEDEALDSLSARLQPIEDRFPMRLARHAAFHTPLLDPVAALAQEALHPDLFRAPRRPLVDGRGVIWRTAVPDLEALYHYTLADQITRTYDFTRAVDVAVKEFAPERIIITGPGASLGAPVAQILLALGWRNLTSREAFAKAQQDDPLILSMGLEDRRPLVTGPAA
ncbi:MAG: ACP S-malonyltransferase [Alphaproteobacteria bacterium]